MPRWPLYARHLVYAQHPVRRARQIVADAVVIAWVAAWVAVGLVVHRAVVTLAEVGYGVQSGAAGIADNLQEAGATVGRLPGVGDSVQSPFTGAADSARGIADSGAALGDRITWLALVMALALSGPPILTVVVSWLWVRLRFARRAAAVRELADTSDGRRLLALRALSTQSVRRLCAIDPDPLPAWERNDVDVVTRLAALEMRTAGVLLKRDTIPGAPPGP